MRGLFSNFLNLPLGLVLFAVEDSLAVEILHFSVKTTIKHLGWMTTERIFHVGHFFLAVTTFWDSVLEKDPVGLKVLANLK